MRTYVLFALLVVVAGARLLLQVVATPAYAGLDEPYHVARIAFVRGEGRNPSLAELSVPHYIGSALREGAPLFGRALADRPCTLTPHESKNYEAQQPSLYYGLVAPFGGKTLLSELRAFRFFSLLCGIAIVVATALIAFRIAGPAGILAAALIASFPTWETLVARASNDALACALAAVALAVTAAAPRRLFAVLAEAVLWGLAIAAKLIVWPLAVAIPFFWRSQRASRTRIAVVTLAGLAAAAFTMLDLHARAGNPFGDVGLNATKAAAAAQPIDYFGMVKVTIASAIWTSGQHANALTSPAMLLYAVPLLAAAALAVRRSLKGDSAERSMLLVAFAALAAFALAQGVHAAGFIRQARAAGLALPLGGKEGWYWYALVPLVIAAFLAPAVRRWWWIAIWIVGWDVVITESALFRDYGGLTSPAHPSLLFRWGPWGLPFGADPSIAALGPFANHLTAIRVVHLVGLAAILVIVRRSNLENGTSEIDGTPVQQEF